MTSQDHINSPESDEMNRRDFMRKGALVVGASATLVTLGGLLDRASLAAGSERGPKSVRALGAGKTIGVSLNGTADYSKNLASGIAEALLGTRYKLTIKQAGLTSSTEVTNIQSLVDEGVVGIIIEPVATASAGEGAKYAYKHGVPVTNALWAGNTGYTEFYLAGDNVNSVRGGHLIAAWLKKNAKPGPVCVVQGILGQGFTDNFNTGLLDKLKGSAYPAEVKEEGKYTPSLAITIVQSALTAHPDIKIVVDYAAVMGDAISGWLKSKKITDVVHITSDGDATTLHYLSTPYLTADRYYSAAQTGYVCAMAIRHKLEKGIDRPFKLAVDQSMMTGANMKKTLDRDPMYYKKEFSKVAKAGF